MTGEKSEEFRGKTVEAAISAGLAALRLSRDEAEIEIIRPGSRGVLGIGAEDAVVRISKARPAKAAAEPSAPRSESRPPAVEPAPTPIAPQTPKPPAKSAEPKPQAAAQPPDDKALAVAQKGQELLSGLLSRMGIAATVEIVPQSDAETDGSDRSLVLNIVGDDLGMLIGRQNETLSALEFVTRLMVNQQVRSRTSFTVDVNGYRAKRAEALRKLAQRMADQVMQNGRTVSLEPMPPAERRIVHLALQDHPSVFTQSIGDGDRRKVTIVLKKD